MIILIIIIASLTGLIVSLCAHAMFSLALKLQIEKHIKARLERTKEIQLRGLSGNAMFLSEKIGKHIATYNSVHLARYSAHLRTLFSILGNPYISLAPHTFIGIQLLAAFGLTVFVALLFNTWNIIVLFTVAAGGLFIPLAILKQKVRERHQAIFRQIPDILDLLSLMIEAGIDFSAAFQRIITLEKGPLIDEFRYVQQEIHLGKPRSEAFKDMAARVVSKPLMTMVNSFTMAFKTGGSIAPTLKALSAQFRVERTQLAEKMAQEAPIKLLIPLVIFIFPTIFVILFGPILLSFLNN